MGHRGAWPRGRPLPDTVTAASFHAHVLEGDLCSPQPLTGALSLSMGAPHSRPSHPQKLSLRT